MISIDRLSFSYGKKVVFDGLDLVFRDGETVMITGPNGAGKSTLLRLLAGVLKPDSGSIDLGLPGDPRRRTAFLPDSLSLYRSMSPRRAADLHARVFGTDPSDFRLARQAGVDLDEPIADLSTGQRVLVHLDIVLSICPELVLVDEVLYPVDPFLRDLALREIIRSIGDNGPMTLMANLNCRSIEHLVDRVVFLGRSGIVLDGYVDEIKASTGRLTLRESEPVPPGLPVLLSRRVAGGVEHILHPIQDAARIPGIQTMSLSDLMDAFMGVEYHVH